MEPHKEELSQLVGVLNELQVVNEHETTDFFHRVVSMVRQTIWIM